MSDFRSTALAELVRWLANRDASLAGSELGDRARSAPSGPLTSRGGSGCASDPLTWNVEEDFVPVVPRVDEAEES